MISRTEQRQAGFTLLEIIVVLVVLGLIAGLVVARGAPHSPALDLRAAASDVAQSLRVARTRAIASNHPVTLTFDFPAHRYRIGRAEPRLLPPSMSVSVIAVAENTSGSRLAGISFAPDGSSSGGRVELAEGSRRIQVGVDWLTGRVSVANAP